MSKIGFPAKAGVHIQVTRANGKVYDFGRSVEGNKLSLWKQRFRIWYYVNVISRLDRRRNH